MCPVRAAQIFRITKLLYIAIIQLSKMEECQSIARSEMRLPVILLTFRVQVNVDSWRMIIIMVTRQCAH